MRFSTLSSRHLGYLAVACLATWLALGASGRQASAQPPGVTPEQIKEFQELQRRDPAKAQQMMEQFMRSRGGGGPPGGEQPKPDDKPKDDKPKEEGGDKPSAGDAETVKRPDKPDEKANPDELKAAPDKDGLVQFSFQGQPWRDVLQWYADVAGLSFDWTELPGGYLNLTTTRKYTLDETSNLLNQHLLARGFTMIQRGEVLSAVKIDKLDPSLVPQVDPDELEDYPPYDFVRVRFSLPENMDPEKAKEDVKILLSPNSKVVPLLASKRLLVIDAVVNLRDVRDLLYSEQLAIKSDVRPQPFMIRYQRADWIADQVMIVLGLDPASRKGPQELQLEQQKMQLMMQMQQRGSDVSKMIKQDGPPVYIAVDKRRNAILVNAPPEQMAIIERTIAELDVPAGGGEAASSGQMEMRKYRTATASPDSIMSALKEIGNLDPLTQLQSDKKSKTLFAYATPRDHEKIQAMIDKLDGSGRGLRVIPLSRRSPADQVAGTIHALMVGEEKKEDNNSRRNRMYFGWGGYGNEEEETETGDFRIQADVENNRLLLWSTDAEYDEVMGLLTTLGVVSLPGGGGDRLRVIEARDPASTARLLERLQRSWSGDNPLIINGPEKSDEDQPDAKPDDAQPQDDEAEDRLTGAPDRRVRIAGMTTPVQFVQTTTDEAATGAAAATEKPGPPAPIHVTVTPDGRIVMSSEDAAALDELEDLMLELEPPDDDFAIFQLYNSRASLVSLNLEEYFEEELKGQKETIYDYWGDYAGTKDKNQGSMTLGRRRPLRFIWDSDTNTIVVQGASRSQLKVIEKLIKIYDEPVGEDAVASRRTEAIPILYSRAADIATALKEVYRDLLSSKDKEFANGKDGQKTSRSETYYRFYRGGDDDKNNKKSAPVKMAFEGALSIGVDEISNTLIISAEEQVWSSIREIVRQLDEEANPKTTVELYAIDGAVNTAALKTALTQALSQPWPGGKPPGQAGENQGGKKNGGDNNDNGNDGNNRRNRGGNN
ncbi:MAG: hypothetical protein KDA44_14385 [Planctomycetales bacterium]|nr:hypothetical protein [Planctomycetales bacterium]